MKIRHAAALALVGWYLMVPYEDQSSHSEKWTVLATFADYRSCVSAVAELQAEGRESSAVFIIPKPLLAAWQKESVDCDRFNPPRLGRVQPNS